MHLCDAICLLKINNKQSGAALRCSMIIKTSAIPNPVFGAQMLMYLRFGHCYCVFLCAVIVGVKECMISLA